MSRTKQDEGVWLVGFTVPFLNSISLMSGLVDVVDICVDSRHRAAIFVVKNLDQTNCLFKNGFLKATRIEKWSGEPQPVVMDCDSVEIPNGAVVS